jgi:hypothetical protein
MNNQGRSLFEEKVRLATSSPEPGSEFSGQLWAQIVELSQVKNTLLPTSRPVVSARVNPRWGRKIPVSSRLQAGFILLLAVLLAGILLFTTPIGISFAHTIMDFFTRAASDTLPLQPWQKVIPTQSGTPTPDPASILDAHLSIEEVRQLAGFTFLEPSYMSESLPFSGASFDSTQNIVRIFYGSASGNGLVVREEPFENSSDCELCGEVGLTADIEKVQIGDAAGEYVVGVWNLTDKGPVWVSDPYLQKLRWQSNNIAFELLYMGQPSSLQKEELVQIAESLK